MDPLGGSTHHEHSTQGHSAALPPQGTNHSPLSRPSNISPLAPRSPLPGQQTGHYRPQPPPSSNAWGSPTSPSSPSPTQQRGSHASPASPTRVPRDAQTYSSPTRERERERRMQDEEDDEPLGQGKVVQRNPNPNPNGQAGERTMPMPPDPFVRIKVLGLEKNKRDVWIKFTAESNLPTYRHSTYRNITRSFTDFQTFASALSATCPQSIIPALPLIQTSATTVEEDDRLIKFGYQKWLGRLCGDEVVIKDEEMRSFIESEFGYTPNPRSKRKAPSTFHFPRGAKLPGESDDSLTIAKQSMARLETSFLETSRAVEKVSRARRAVAGALGDNAEQLNAFSTTEGYQPLAVGFKKLARGTKMMADLYAAQSASEMITLGDGLAYQSLNAHSAKDTLGCRDSIVDEHRNAAKSTIAKRRAIERLKAGSSIKADKVDEALEELDEAKRHEVLLAQRLTNISQNLQPSLRTHSRNAHEDIISSLLEHARTSIIYEKQLLKELETLRPELQNIRKPESGVYYHNTTPAPAPAPMSPTTASNRPDLPRTSSIMSRNSSSGSTTTSPVLTRGQMNNGGRFEGNGTKSMIVGRGAPNFGEELPPTPTPGTAGRRSINSMARSVIVQDDRRQKVDAKMAASMLANGF